MDMHDACAACSARMMRICSELVPLYGIPLTMYDVVPTALLIHTPVGAGYDQFYEWHHHVFKIHNTAVFWLPDRVQLMLNSYTRADINLVDRPRAMVVPGSKHRALTVNLALRIRMS